MARMLRAAVRTIVLVPLFFAYTLLQATHVVWIGRRNRDSPKIEEIIQTWSRCFLRIPPIELSVEGAEHVVASKPYVVVSNHISNFDIPVLFRSIPTPIRFLAKKELYKIPLLGPGLDVAGIVKVDRDGAPSTQSAINAAARETYRRGYSLMVFAEGTRSRTGEMGRFHRGAVRIAIDNEADLLPVVVFGSFEISPPGSWLIHSGRVHVRILPPVPVHDVGVRQIRAVTEDLRATMGAVYDELRAADAGGDDLP